MESENTPSDVEKTLSAFKLGINDKLNSWDNMLKSKKDKIKKLKEEEQNCKGQKENLDKKIKEIQENLSELEAQKWAKLEAEGVSKKLSDLNCQIKSLKSQQETNTTSFPECPVCLEICNPSQGRLVFCCPEGHIICGQCDDKVTECPTCRRAKSSFGGTFTRCRWFERKRKAPSDLDDLNIFEKVCALGLLKRPLEERKEQLESDFNYKKDPFKKEISALKDELMAVEKDFDRIIKDLQMAEKDLATLAETLNSGISQFAGLTNYLDICGKSSKTFSFNTLSCFCALSCPHPLIVGTNGRILGETCGCIKQAPCLCVTHQITLDLAIEGGSSGSITIDLAGRTHPRAVSRFFRVASENFYAGLVVNDVLQDDCIVMGVYGIDWMSRNFTSFSQEEKVLDSTNMHLLRIENKFAVGILNFEDECESQQITIYMKNAYPDVFDRTVGIVTRGTEIIEEINNLPFDDFDISPVIIKKSFGKIVSRPIQL